MSAGRFSDIDWTQLSQAELQSINARVSSALKGRRSQPKVEVPEVLRGGDRYKASVAKVVPGNVRERLGSYRRCMLGVSLGSKNSEGPYLEGTLQWIAENFDSCALLVGDSVYRYTLQLTRGLDAESSLPAAMEIGRQFIGQHQSMVDKLAGGPCRFEFVPCSRAAKSPDFGRFHEQLRTLYGADEPFRQTVDAFAEIYLGRGEQSSSDGQRVEKTRIATEYLLEESAIFACMVQQGTPVFVYPGSIKSFEDIVEGAHPGVPAELKQVVFVSLRLKRGGAHFVEVPTQGAQTPQTVAVGGPNLEVLEPEAHALLAGLPEEGWAKLTAHTEVVRVPSGTVVVRRGESDRAMYILTEGRMEIAGASDRRVALIDPGSVFGEQAFVDASPRSASVSAITDCTALRLTPEGFTQLQANEPEIAFQLLLDIARVLSHRLRGR